MAFGKDPSRLGKMNFLQQGRAATKRAPRTGGGGRPAFVDKYQPTMHGTDLIRLIRGEYVVPIVDKERRDFVRDANGEPVMQTVPWLPHIDYFHAIKQRGVVSTEGPLGEFKGKGEPCVAADWFWWEWAERQRTGNKKSPRSISRREMFTFSVLVMAPFYKAPQLDKHGNVRMNPNTNEPYTEWVKGSKRGNDEYAAKGYERKEGHLQHWSMGSGHFNTLLDYSRSVGRHCNNCGSTDTIEEIAWVCRGCGEAIIDLESTTYDDAMIEKMTEEPVICPNCDANGYLEDVYNCTACSNADKATIFDVDLEVKRVQQTSDRDSNNTVLSIVRCSPPKPIDDIYGEDLRKPLPLEKTFAPTPIEKQIEYFGVPPDRGQEVPPRTPVNNSRPYGQN